MKKINLTLLALVVAIAAMASPRNSKVVFSLTDKSNFVFEFDGSLYQEPTDKIRINNVKPGVHDIRVFKRTVGHTMGHGHAHSQVQDRLIYSGSVRIKPRSKVRVKLNRSNRLMVNVFPMNNNNGYGNGYGNGYNAGAYGGFSNNNNANCNSGYQTGSYGGYTNNNGYVNNNGCNSNNSFNNNNNYNSSYGYGYGSFNDCNTQVNVNNGCMGNGCTQSCCAVATTSTWGTGNTGYYGSNSVGNGGCAPVVNNCNTFNFQDLVYSVNNASFDQTRLQIAKQGIRSNPVNSRQVAQLMDQLSFESSKLALAKYAHYFVVDPQNFYVVNNSLTFSSSVRELNNFIAYH